VTTPTRCELAVDGMTCASCAASVARVLRGQPGVRDARVDFMLGRAVVESDGTADPSNLARAVGAAGYPSRAIGGDRARGPAGSRLSELDAAARRDLRSLGWRLAIAVAFGSVLARLPERPIQLVVGALFILGGVLTWRAGGEEASAGRQWSRSMSSVRVAWTAASVILIAEFADLTQLATAGFAARFDDPLAVFVGAATALASVSGLAVIAGSWLTTRVPLRVIQRAAAVLFVVIGVVTLVGVLA